MPGTPASSIIFNNSGRFLRAVRLIILVVLTGASVEAAFADTLLIRNATIVSPDAEVAGEMDVLIEDGRVAKIDKALQQADQVIDATGKYLIPGLIDSHVHLGEIPGYRAADGERPAWVREAEAQIPRSYLYFGFTTLLDLASTPMAMAAWQRHPLAPDTYFCGPVPIPNGYPLPYLDPQALPPDGSRYLLYDPRQHDNTPEGIGPASHSPEAVVQRVARDGARCLKTFYEHGFGPHRDLPVPTTAMGQRLVKAAHEHSLPVFLHANSRAAYEFGLTTGVDVYAHGLWSWGSAPSGSISVIEKLVNRIADAGIAVQPTLQVLHGEPALFDPDFFRNPRVKAVMTPALIHWYQSPSGQWMKTSVRERFGDDPETTEELRRRVAQVHQTLLDNVYTATRELARQDVQLLFGSDTPSGPYYTQFPGLNGYLEIQRWQEAGVSLETIFRALTIDNARALAIADEVGSIAVGKVANLLLLEDNPLRSAAAYDSIDMVILHGKPMRRHTLAADTDRGASFQRSRILTDDDGAKPAN